MYLLFGTTLTSVYGDSWLVASTRHNIRLSSPGLSSMEARRIGHFIALPNRRPRSLLLPSDHASDKVRIAVRALSRRSVQVSHRPRLRDDVAQCREVPARTQHGYARITQYIPAPGIDARWQDRRPSASKASSPGSSPRIYTYRRMRGVGPLSNAASERGSSICRQQEGVSDPKVCLTADRTSLSASGFSLFPPDESRHWCHHMTKEPQRRQPRNYPAHRSF